jgi:hypothetical protein
MSDWFDDYCFGWSNIPTCEFYRWLENNPELFERAHSCATVDELQSSFSARLVEFNAKDINWNELYQTLNFES